MYAGAWDELLLKAGAVGVGAHYKGMNLGLSVRCCCVTLPALQRDSAAAEA